MILRVVLFAAVVAGYYTDFLFAAHVAHMGNKRYPGRGQQYAYRKKAGKGVYV
jgi:hypothetical protein